MDLLLLRFLAMTLGPAITSAARPAATFWGVQLMVSVFVYQELASVPAAMQWLISPAALLLAGALAGLETAAKHDPDIAGVLRDLKLDNVTGAFGAFSAALLFAALGMPEAQASALIDTEAAANLTHTTLGLLSLSESGTAAEPGFGVQAAIIGAAVALNLGLTWLRSQFLEFVDDFGLGALWAKLETGGVVGVLILLPFLPLIVFAFLIIFALLLSALALAARRAERSADRRARLACANCGYQLRAEASLCAACKTERTPTQAVRTGFATALHTLRHRAESTSTE